MPTAAARIAAFRALHHEGCFVLPNPWDEGSARILAHLGFKALASTSAGAAWSMGRPDGGVGLDEMLAHLQMLADATDLPLNADFLNGFADHPEAVAANVERAVQTGVAGLSIEDSTGRADEPLYDLELAIARIKAARDAIDQTGSGVVLTARCEAFLVGRHDLPEVLGRLKAYARAGADCLYAPGLPDLEAVGEVVRAADLLPVNAIISRPGFTVPQLREAGVRRVSVGGALARAAYGAFIAAARQIGEDGAFQPFPPLDPFHSLNEAFT